MGTSLYLKYKGDRSIARWLNTQHKRHKESKNDDRVANISENPQTNTPTCKVSLPIEAFHNYLMKRAASEMETMTEEDIRFKKKRKLTDVKTSPELFRPNPEAFKSKTAQLQIARNKTIVSVPETRSVPGPGESPIVPSNLLTSTNLETKNEDNNSPLTKPDFLDADIFKIPQSVCPTRKKKVPGFESQSVPITGQLPIEPLNLHINKQDPNSSATLKLRMVRPQNKLIIPLSEGRSLPGAGKVPTITSNVIISKETKRTEINAPITKHNFLNSATMIPPKTISFKHKPPVSTLPDKGKFCIVPNMGTSITDPKLGVMESSTIDANKYIRRHAETFVQTENVFFITDDDSKRLDLITNNGVTEEELIKWLDKRRKKIDNKITTDIIIDVDEDDENKNIYQDTLNLALFHSQNNKNRLLSEMAQSKKPNANQLSDTVRATQSETPFSQTALQNLIEANKSLIQIAFERFALTNRIDPPATTEERNTQTEENTNMTPSDFFNREHHNTNPQQLVTMPNQQNQYDPQAVLMQKGQSTQQMLQSGHQQSYIQMQPFMQQQQNEYQHRFQFPHSEHQHRLQLQQPEHQQRVPETPHMKQHFQSQSSQFQRLQSQNQLQQRLHLQQPQMQRQPLQHQSPMELQNQNSDQLQSSHNGEHQNELFQQQQLQQTQMPPNMQNYLNHSKPPASKDMIQLFPGDPRYKTLRNQLAASNQKARLMSTYEANMRTAQQTHQNYQQQYQPLPESLLNRDKPVKL